MSALFPRKQQQPYSEANFKTLKHSPAFPGRFGSAEDKKLFWIEGTDLRFQGYNYFGEHPELVLEWFDTHM